MHAATARAWLVGGLVHLLLAGLSGTLLAGGVAHAKDAHVVLLAAAAGHLAAALVLGLAPAYLRRDWPSPLPAYAALLLAGLADAAFLVTGRVDVLAALHGAALLLAALAPAMLVPGPRWAGSSILARGEPYRSGDTAAGIALAAALVGLATGGALLVALPRGLPYAGTIVVLLGAAIPAALAGIAFGLARDARRPSRGATLYAGAAVLLLLAAAGLAWGLVWPLGADLRAPGLVVAAGLALAALAAWRDRPDEAAGPQVGALVLAFLAAVVTPLAVAGGVPNALAPVALYALAVAAVGILAVALALVAPLTLPGRARRERAAKWAAVVGIAGLFLLAPAFAYPRPPLPGALALFVAGVLLVVALAPLASTASSGRRASRRR